MLRRFTGTLIAGLFALLPMVITVAIVVLLVNKLVQWFGPQSQIGMVIVSALDIPRWLSYLIALAAVICFIWVVGVLAKRITGRKISALIEEGIAKIPFINKVYSSVDQVVAMFQKKDDAAAALSNVVLATIANVSVLGMLASDDPVIIDGVPHFLVYLPSTPIPSSGQNLLIPCDSVRDVDVTVEEMTKILISLGSLGPRILNAKSPLFISNPALTATCRENE